MWRPTPPLVTAITSTKGRDKAAGLASEVARLKVLHLVRLRFSFIYIGKPLLAVIAEDWPTGFGRGDRGIGRTGPCSRASARQGCLYKCDWDRGDGKFCRAVVIGVIGGLLAAVAYDVFRLPFVFAKEWGIASIVPPMKRFKVFPRFGAM